MPNKAIQTGRVGRNQRNWAPFPLTGVVRKATKEAHARPAMSDAAIARRTTKSRRPRQLAPARSSAPRSRPARPAAACGTRRGAATLAAWGSGAFTQSTPPGAEPPGTDRDRSAAILKRFLRRLDQAHNVAAELAVTRWRGLCLHRTDEVLELDRQRLGAVHVRREDVAGSVGELILAERGRVLVDDPVIEDPHRLGRAVVVHHHLFAADDHRAPQLARREPAHFHVHERPGRESERDEDRKSVV